MIELIVIDVDGTLTDGKIYYDNKGENEFKAFNVKDGLMIKSWHMLGKKSAIITGRDSRIVERRANELKVDYISQGIDDKKTELQRIMAELGIEFQNVAIIGDDMNDYSMLKCVEKSFCPKDANVLIQDAVNYTLHKEGGKGCVAEMIKFLLKEENLEDKFIALWE